MDASSVACPPRSRWARRGLAHLLTSGSRLGAAGVARHSGEGVAGRDPVRLGFLPEVVAWSWDSQRLAFSRDDRIIVMNADGSDVRRVPLEAKPASSSSLGP